MTTREAITAALRGKGWRLSTVLLNDARRLRFERGAMSKAREMGAELQQMFRKGEVVRRLVDGHANRQGSPVYIYRLREGA